MNARPLSVVLVLAALGLCLVDGWAAGRPALQARAEPYTEPQLVELLAKVFVHWRGDKAEKFIFITEDGQVFTFGGDDPNAVSVSLFNIIRSLARGGQHLGTVTNVVHNHNFRLGGDFSPGDIAACKTLRKHGFTGKFQIFYPVSWRIITLKGR